MTLADIEVNLTRVLSDEMLSLMEQEQLHCPTCQSTITKEYNFCPMCGKKFHEPPQSTDIGRQIVVYLVSIFLPPLGLWPGIKYLRQKDKRSKIVGAVAIFLTIASTVISIWLSAALIDQYTKELNNQMQLYRQMGY